MKFSTLSLRSPRLLTLSSAFIVLALGLFITSTTADDGTQSRYTRVLSNGYVEVSNQPFVDSSFSNNPNGWNGNLATGPLGLNLIIREAESVGVTHAYIPVSIEGSSCPIVRTQILLNAPSYRNHRQSDIIILSSSHPVEIVRVANLVPNTRYQYRILARGCNMTAATYKRELVTLNDPTPRYAYTQPKTSAPVVAVPEPAIEPVVIEEEPIMVAPAVFENEQFPTIFEDTPEAAFYDDSYVEETSVIEEESDSRNFFERIGDWIKRIWTKFLNTRDRSSEEADPQDDVFVQDTEPLTEESQPEEESLIERERGVRLPTTARGWVAVILLVVGTAGIIGSFISTRKKAE